MQSVKTAGSNEIFLVDNDPSVLIDMFKTKLPLVQAAGGLVRNKKGKMLFIFRKNKWDLPKGKVDKERLWKMERCAKWKKKLASKN